MTSAGAIAVEPRPVSRFVWAARERYRRDRVYGGLRGLVFDPDAARKVECFFHLLLRHSKGEFAGKPFRLSMWQRHDIVRPLFGWKRVPGPVLSEALRARRATKGTDGTDESAARGVALKVTRYLESWVASIPFELRLAAGIVRRFNTAYLEMARKQGKSTLMSGTGLYMENADQEALAEVYSAATKKDQAKLVHGEAVRMRNKSPDLRRVLLWAKSLNSLVNKVTESIFIPLGSKEDSFDGLNSHCNIIDELHAHRTPEVWEILTTGEGTRRQPMTVAITTAGRDRNRVCYDQRRYGIGVLEGSGDDSWFVFIACLDEQDDVFDAANLWKANPNLGISVKMDYLMRRMHEAKTGGGKLGIYLRMHCGIWIDIEEKLLSSEKWMDPEGCAAPFDPAELDGEPVMIGLDLAHTRDLVAKVLVFKVHGGYAWLPTFWCPREKALELEKSNFDRYVMWAREGYVNLVDTPVLDYDLVYRSVLEDKAKYKVQQVCIDPWSAAQLQLKLEAAGFDVMTVRQGPASLSEATKELQACVDTGTLRHNGHPVLQWMAGNVVARAGENDTVIPSKLKSTGKIDGIAAGLNGMRGWCVKDVESVYSERGLRTF